MQLTFVAKGLNIAVNAIRREHGNDAPIHCVTKTDKVWLTAHERAAYAEANGRLDSDALQTWWEVKQLSACPFITGRTPQTTQEGVWVEEVWRVARTMRPEALADYVADRDGDGDTAVLMLPCIKSCKLILAPDHFLVR